MKKEGSQVVHVDKDSVPSVGVAEEEIIQIGKKNECRSLSERNTLARNFQTRRPRYCSNSSFIFSFALTLVLSMQENLAFTTHPSLKRQPHKLSTTQSTKLNLIPLTDFQNELTFFSSSDDNRCCIDKTGKYTPTTAELQDDGEPFQLYLVEEEDLAEVSLFIVKAFGADAISLSSNEFSAFEKGVMAPALDFFNGYSAVTAFAEVLWGLRIRQADRVPLTNILNKEESQAGVKSNVVNDISPPEMQGLESAKEKIEAANRKSLILVLARQSTNKENTTESKWTSVDSNIDVIASVELRLQVSHRNRGIPFFFVFAWNNMMFSCSNVQIFAFLNSLLSSLLSLPSTTTRLPTTTTNKQQLTITISHATQKFRSVCPGGTPRNERLQNS